MQSFSIHFRTLSAQVPPEGPIPLSLKITYHGDDKVNLLDADYIDFSFKPPRNWKLKEFSPLYQINGRIPTVTLAKGQSLSRTIYLHDYFSSIVPGMIELTITVTIGLEEQSIILEDSCTFEVLKPNAKSFKARIKEIHSQINQEKSAEIRLELYKSIVSLSHSDLIPLLLQSLLDHQLLIFHSTARIRLVDLCETYNKRELIVTHLLNHGSRYDNAFFTLWNERQIHLSEIEINQLCESSSLWVKLFCLENYDKQYNRKGLLESLGAELEELTERAKKLGKD